MPMQTNLSRLIALAVAAVVTVAAQVQPSDPLPPVELVFEHAVPLNPDAMDALRAAAIRLAESSSIVYGSGHRAGRSNMDSAHLHDHYRHSVRGNYLAVRFEPARTIKVAGDDVTVAEIVVGLDEVTTHYVPYAIDADGHLLGFAKWYYPRVQELEEIIAKIVNPLPAEQEKEK